MCDHVFWSCQVLLRGSGETLLMFLCVFTSGGQKRPLSPAQIDLIHMNREAALRARKKDNVQGTPCTSQLECRLSGCLPFQCVFCGMDGRMWYSVVVCWCSLSLAKLCTDIESCPDRGVSSRCSWLFVVVGPKRTKTERT